MERYRMQEPRSRGPDPQAVRTARGLQAAYLDCTVILFGSRARTDWGYHSDIDLMLVGDFKKAAQRACRDRAYRIACATYATEPPALDLKFMAPIDYYEQIHYSRNRIGAVAHRDGIAMGHFTPPPQRRARETASNPANRESHELRRRLQSAHTHYRKLHIVLDADPTPDEVSVYLGHQVLEHALKALICAQGKAYPRLPDLPSLAETADISLSSDWALLNEYAGGARYDAPPLPMSDFGASANEITFDLTEIFRRIERLTGTDPWAMDGAYGARERKIRRADNNDTDG